MRHDLRIVGTDGYTSVIEDAGLGSNALLVTVTRASDHKSWRGQRDTIEDALLLVAKIINDQTLIAQMHEGDRHDKG